MQELHALQRQVDEKCHPTGLCSFTAFVWRFSLCYTEQEEKKLCSSGWISKGCQGSRMNPTTALAPAPLQWYHANRIRGLLGPVLESEFLLHYPVLSLLSPEIIVLLIFLQSWSRLRYFSLSLPLFKREFQRQKCFTLKRIIFYIGIPFKTEGCNTLGDTIFLWGKQKIGPKNTGRIDLTLLFIFILPPINLILLFNLLLDLLTCTEDCLYRSLLLENHACLRGFIGGKDNKNNTQKCWGRIFSKWEGSIFPWYFPKCSNIWDYLWQCKQKSQCSLWRMQNHP